jgi:hypothetical protein
MKGEARVARIFNEIRKGLEAARTRYDWSVNEDGLYQAEAPGFISLQLHLKDKHSQVSPQNIAIKAATSRELTGDEYRVCVRFWKGGGHINANTDVVVSIPRYGIPRLGGAYSISNSFPSPEEYWDDFSGSIMSIKKWFGMPGDAGFSKSYSSLLSLANPRSNSEPEVYGETARSYYPQEEGEFLFVRGPLSYMR